MSARATEDLETLARQVERAAHALEVSRRALATGASEDPVCPLDALRGVAGKRAYDGLLLAAPSRAQVPLRASLARWVAQLTGVRVGWELEVDEAKARRAQDDPASARAVRRGVPTPGGASEAILGLLAAGSAGEAESFADRATRHAPRVCAARDQRRERLEEVARRLGATSRFARALVYREPGGIVPEPAGGSEPGARPGSSLVVGVSSDLIALLAAELTPAPRDAPDAALPGLDEHALRDSAVAFLQGSEALARTLVRRAHRARTGREGLAGVDALGVALGRETRSADWPARLSVQWLSERYVALAGKTRAQVSLRAPAPLGVASFLLAAARFGEALHRQESLRYASFALAHDPQFVDAHRTGALFACSLGSPAFLARELGTGRGPATDTARVLGACLLFAARARATELLIALEGSSSEVARASDGAIGGLFARTGFLSPNVHDDTPARWLATLTAHPHHEAYVSMFDEDYYRNPRAGRALRARFALPALSTTLLAGPPPAPVSLAAALVATFERELG